jgi:hypothetical protein
VVLVPLALVALLTGVLLGWAPAGGWPAWWVLAKGA